MSKKLELTGTTLVDLLVVAKALPSDEKEQIIAFGGNPSPEAIAVSLFGSTPLIWTIREIESGEPLAVGGWIQTGPVIFRSFFLANERIWEEHGAEVTKLVAETIDETKEQFDYARFETYCLASRNRKVPEWYEKLGLTYDATLRGFGVNGEDALLYSTVKSKSSIQLVDALAGATVN